MAFIPAPSVLQVELVYSWDTQVVQTVLHFRPDGLLDPIEVAEFLEFLATWFDETLAPALPTTISLVNIKATDLTTETAPVYLYAVGMPNPGTNPGSSLPNNCALVITKRTAMRGRSFRGRIFHPGLLETSVTANTVNSSTVANLILYYSELLEVVLTEETWRMGVLSRYADNAPRAEAVFTPVTSLDSDGVVDSQRRRLPRRGA